jgi:hypothetical protein
MAGGMALVRPAARRSSVLLVIVVMLAATSGLPGLASVALAADARAGDEARIEEATRLFVSGRYEEAERWLAVLVVEHPENASLQRKLGLCYYYLRRSELALAHLRAYLARGSGISAQDREDVERWIGEMEGVREPIVGPAAPALKSAPFASLSVVAALPSPPARPSFRRGVLVLPYAGWQFPVQGPAWMMHSSFRFGMLVGGRLSGNVSLSFEPAFSSWAFGTHHTAQFDNGATLLYHVSGSRTELFFGPKLAWSVVLRNNFDEHTYAYVNGIQIGAKAGLFVALHEGVALGFMLNLANTQSNTSDSSCFGSNGSGEVDCNQTDSTALAAVSGGIFF